MDFLNGKRGLEAGRTTLLSRSPHPGQAKGAAKKGRAAHGKKNMNYSGIKKVRWLFFRIMRRPFKKTERGCQCG